MKALVRFILTFLILSSLGLAQDLNKKILHAVDIGDLRKLKFYLSKGASIYAQDRHGQDLMDYAIVGKHLNIVKYLIRNGFDITCNKGKCEYLHLAASINYEITKYLISQGASVNALDDFFKSTPLAKAASSNKVKIIKLLLKKGAKKTINDQNKFGRTALMDPAAKGYFKAVVMLLKAGATVNIQDNKGQTALFQAARSGKLNIVKLLIQYGADSQIKGLDDYQLNDSGRYTPREIAKKYKHSDVVRYLDTVK